MKLHTFKIGGVHPAENKIAAGKPIVNMPLPAEVVLPVAQHIGAPAKPIVAKGDHVKRGDRVAEAGGFVSAHVHTPISGTVVKIDTARTPQGMPVEAIYIKSDEADREADAATMADTMPKRSDAEIAALDSKAIIELIKDAGIVGLGGATFPAHVKLMPPPGSKAEVVIINAARERPRNRQGRAVAGACSRCQPRSHSHRKQQTRGNSRHDRSLCLCARHRGHDHAGKISPRR